IEQLSLQLVSRTASESLRHLPRDERAKALQRASAKATRHLRRAVDLGYSQGELRNLEEAFASQFACEAMSFRRKLEVVGRLYDITSGNYAELAANVRNAIAHGSAWWEYIGRLGEMDAFVKDSHK